MFPLTEKLHFLEPTTTYKTMWLSGKLLIIQMHDKCILIYLLSVYVLC